MPSRTGRFRCPGNDRILTGRCALSGHCSGSLRLTFPIEFSCVRTSFVESGRQLSAHEHPKITRIDLLSRIATMVDDTMGARGSAKPIVGEVSTLTAGQRT